MRKLFSEVLPHRGSGPDFPGVSLAGAHSCEIVSGYITPRALTERNPPAKTSIRKQVAILYADISGPALPKTRGDADFDARLDEAIRILMVNIADNGGRLVGIDGHAVLAEFENTDQALHCAIEVQLEARRWNASLPVRGQLLFRIGLASGSRTSDRGTNEFKSTTLAAYLDKLAFSGGICISESVREQLDGHPSLRLVAAGKQYIKDIFEPVESFWIEIDTDRFVTRGSTGAVRVKANDP